MACLSPFSFWQPWLVTNVHRRPVILTAIKPGKAIRVSSFLLDRSHARLLWVFCGSHNPLLGKLKKKQAGVLKMVEVEIHNQWVFVRHDTIQHDGAIWNVGHAWQYHKDVNHKGMIWTMPSYLQMVLILGAKVRCLGCVKVRHLMMSLMSLNQTVPIAVMTVVLRTLDWALAIWGGSMNGLAPE